MAEDGTGEEAGLVFRFPVVTCRAAASPLPARGVDLTWAQRRVRGYPRPVLEASACPEREGVGSGLGMGRTEGAAGVAVLYCTDARA
jgi:hypothetical protein